MERVEERACMVQHGWAGGLKRWAAMLQARVKGERPKSSVLTSQRRLTTGRGRFGAESGGIRRRMVLDV